MKSLPVWDEDSQEFWDEISSQQLTPKSELSKDEKPSGAPGLTPVLVDQNSPVRVEEI